MMRFANQVMFVSISSLLLLGQKAPDPRPGERFKLGTFEHQGRELIGLVLRDALVVDLKVANASLERRNATWVRLPMPEDMSELAGRYQYDLRERIHAIVDAVSEALADGVRPSYLLSLSELVVLPPVRPRAIWAAALNYPQHAQEMTSGAPAAMSDASALDDAPRTVPHFWERKPGDTRQNPYLFFKPPAAVIADGEPIRLKPQRDQIDWECEFAFVVGRPASHLPVEKAREHIFGYTIMNDVGDRGGRGDNRYGSDWLVWKGSDTFAPLGPFIVPAELVDDPHNLRIWFTLSGKTMQDSNTKVMHHTVEELLSFVSNSIVVGSGDVIATGTPAGVGMARVPPVFMKPGDVAACSVEGIGTLTNPVAAWADKKPY
jgi:2-keto-4-pentenoate hydratase/2-oxohepta-3-ene-1,7-dioic acid hydratase in catechol pathway